MLYITGDCYINSPILETLHPRLPGLSRTFPKLGGKCCKKETFIKLLQTSSFFPIRSLDYQPQFPELHPQNEQRADSTERRPQTNEDRLDEDASERYRTPSAQTKGGIVKYNRVVKSY